MKKKLLCIIAFLELLLTLTAVNYENYKLSVANNNSIIDSDYQINNETQKTIDSTIQDSSTIDQNTTQVTDNSTNISDNIPSSNNNTNQSSEETIIEKETPSENSTNNTTSATSSNNNSNTNTSSNSSSATTNQDSITSLVNELTENYNSFFR